MPARACADRNDAVDSHFRAFACVAITNHVLKNEAAVGLQFLDQVGVGRQRDYDDRNLMAQDHTEVGLEPIVAVMGDQVDAIGKPVHVLADAGDVLVQRGAAARIKRGHRADDFCIALGDDEFGGRGNEHRTGHDRQANLGAKAHGECVGPGHRSARSSKSPWSNARRPLTVAWKA